MDEKDRVYDDLKNRFLDRCFELVEKGVEDGTFRMKDVAKSLGISSQVASKLVNPTNPRTLTAFELFRLSVLMKRPLTELIPVECYLTPEELEDAELCRLLREERRATSESNPITAIYNAIPAGCDKCALALLQALGRTDRQEGREHPAK